MKLRFIPALCAFIVPAALVLAQPTVREMEEKAQAIAAATAFRIGLSDAVAGGTEKTNAALQRLRDREAPRGTSGSDRDAELAFAAVDIAHRLLSAGKPAEAEDFFREAEKSFDAAIRRIHDDARQQVMLLEALAYIRVRYLGKAKEAKADLDTARRLRPDDKELAARAEYLGQDKAEIFRGDGKN